MDVLDGQRTPLNSHSKIGSVGTYLREVNFSVIPRFGLWFFFLSNQCSLRLWGDTSCGSISFSISLILGSYVSRPKLSTLQNPNDSVAKDKLNDKSQCRSDTQINTPRNSVLPHSWFIFHVEFKYKIKKLYIFRFAFLMKSVLFSPKKGHFWGLDLDSELEDQQNSHRLFSILSNKLNWNNPTRSKVMVGGYALTFGIYCIIMIPCCLAQGYHLSLMTFPKMMSDWKRQRVRESAMEVERVKKEARKKNWDRERKKSL